MTVTKTKVIGFMILLIANLSLILYTHSMISFISAFYALLGCLEYQILHTGHIGMPLSYMGTDSATEIARDSEDIEERGRKR